LFINRQRLLFRRRKNIFIDWHDKISHFIFKNNHHGETLERKKKIYIEKLCLNQSLSQRLIINREKNGYNYLTREIDIIANKDFR
jgi:hypothetical protein